MARDTGKIALGCGVAQLRSDLIRSRFRCKLRGLNQAAKWASEMFSSLPPPDERHAARLDPGGPCPTISEYLLAKDYFDIDEYDRAAYHAQGSSCPEARFLHYYAQYLAAEKRRLDLMTDLHNCSLDAGGQLSLFCDLRKVLQKLKSSERLYDDGFLFYVYGLVLIKLDLVTEALEALETAITLEPLNWSAWHELASIVSDKATLDRLSLPDHWFKHFFNAAVYLELQLNEEALTIYNQLLSTFGSSNYIKTQVAIIKHNLRNVDGAIQLFTEIRQSDPCRLDSMDIFSNLLYVKAMRPELCSLAHSANHIDPFRVETCCCVANYYSLRGQHNKAIQYFNRALQLKPDHLSAWTLMGHEYMEMKNTGAAIQSYRSALKCNKRDYRAWYGLGQTYEILKMPSYCLYYYSVARSLRPNDSRMIIASGETLEKLERYTEALKCYWKAGALFKLANLYEKLGDKQKAAAAYNDFVYQQTDPCKDPLFQQSNLAHAHKFLANYYLGKSNYKLAHRSAQSCVQFTETREEGKNILKQISSLTKGTDLVFT
jgi:anaphase-promoting complex subunit 8